MKIQKTVWLLVGLLGVLPVAAAAQSYPAAKHERRLNQQMLLLEYDEEVMWEQTAPSQPKTSWDTRYLQFKKELNDKMGLQYGMDISHIAQRGAPNGNQTSFQNYYYPYMTWNVLRDSAMGSGQINVNYNLIRYWGIWGSTLQNRLGIVASQNDYTVNQEIFSQASYTHTLPGSMDWLSATVGQFPLYNFDGGNYLDNQQTGLMNYAMSQNASATYANAGVGAYLQVSPENWTFTAGYQDGSNISGQTIRLHTAFDGYYTWFGAVSYSPTVAGLGQGQYSFLYYYQPSVSDQPGISHGYSFNMSQNMGDKWVLSGRANWSDGNIAAIKQSFVLAGTWVNPLNRNANDAITLGVAYNRLDNTAMGAPAFFRKYENALELQWVWGIGKLFTLTPDLQIYPKAAVGQGHKMVTVAGLRAAVLL